MDCTGDTEDTDYAQWQWNMILYILTPLVYFVLFTYCKWVPDDKDDALASLVNIYLLSTVVFFPCLYCSIKPYHIRSYWQPVTVNNTLIGIMENVRCCKSASCYRGDTLICSDFCSAVTINQNVTTMQNTSCLITKDIMCLTNDCIDNTIIKYVNVTRHMYANPYDLQNISSDPDDYDNKNFIASALFMALSGIIMIICMIRIFMLMSCRRTRVPEADIIVTKDIKSDTLSVITQETYIDDTCSFNGTDEPNQYTFI